MLLLEDRPRAGRELKMWSIMLILTMLLSRAKAETAKG
jgi:hypothetical protein